jgi:Family of unknown function (DUF5995)
MRRVGVRLTTLATAIALLTAAPAAHAQTPPPQLPDLPWPELLPPAPSPSNVQPGPVPGCRKPSMACVDRVIRKLRARRNKLGCDHRAVFANTYLLLTQEIKRTIKRNPDFFSDNRWLFTLDATFANFYFELFKPGAELPEAWQIAFDTAASGDQNAAQDMLLGINAHVQRDMPYVMASVGLRKPDGTSRKPDHDAGNRILARGYERIVRDVERRYDPLIAVTNSSATPLDDFGGLEMVKGWREGVWRNAERLLNARTDAERALVAQSIELNAANWARMIASVPGPPGYRGQRDAYCAGKNR